MEDIVKSELICQLIWFWWKVRPSLDPFGVLFQDWERYQHGSAALQWKQFGDEALDPLLTVIRSVSSKGRTCFKWRKYRSKREHNMINSQSLKTFYGSKIIATTWMYLAIYRSSLSTWAWLQSKYNKCHRWYREECICQCSVQRQFGSKIFLASRIQGD